MQHQFLRFGQLINQPSHLARTVGQLRLSIGRKLVGRYVTQFRIIDRLPSVMGLQTIQTQVFSHLNGQGFHALIGIQLLSVVPQSHHYILQGILSIFMVA